MRRETRPLIELSSLQPVLLPKIATVDANAGMRRRAVDHDPRQPVGRAHPDPVLAILEDIPNGIVRQPVFRRKTLEGLAVGVQDVQPFAGTRP